MDTPGIDHVILTVTDAVRSRAFYGDVLGFQTNVLREGADGSFWFKAGPSWIFVVASPQPVPGDRFSEFRVGLDHLGFRAPDRAALDAFAAKLQAAGIPTNGVEQFHDTGNFYVAFRDPDNIQLEYWLEKS
jgi:catechol 2,3-dioxygenase-like lactoylglutathione lyase family enzyme